MPTADPTDPLNHAIYENQVLRQRVAELERRLARLTCNGSDPGVPAGPERDADSLSAREKLLVEAERIGHVGSWVWDVRTNDVLWSDELFRILGYDPARDSASTEAFFASVHPLDRERVRACSEAGVATGVAEQVQFRVLWPDGAIKYVHMTGAMVFDDAGRLQRIVGTVLDVTEAKRHADETTRVADLESELRDAQRLEAIGRLAGGVAHDFNNSLTVILANAELLQRRVPAPELAEIMTAAEGAAWLTKQLLAFGRRAVVTPTVIDVNATVEAACGLVRRVIGENIEIQIELEPASWRVRVDPGHLQQMLLNLALNARDAMPTGGTLRIETANVTRGDDCVAISVSDTGVGMDEATLARAFEPFFTTKPEGEGTGLGLATVFGGVKQSGGEITIDSTVGEGTRVCIYLPRVIEVADPVKARPQAPRRSGETILVVEDDAAVAATIQRTLAAAGYAVLVAPRPCAAQAILARPDIHVELVISDVMMPEMSGPRLVRQIRERGETTKVLFVSGYASDTDEDEASELGPLLGKPFTAEQLLTRVGSLLDEGIRPPG